jgi:hypothetical protein
MRRSMGAGTVAPGFYGVVSDRGGCVGSASAGARAMGLLLRLGAGAAAPDHGVVGRRDRVADSRVRRRIWHPLRI